MFTGSFPAWTKHNLSDFKQWPFQWVFRVNRWLTFKSFDSQKDRNLKDHRHHGTSLASHPPSPNIWQRHSWRPWQPWDQELWGLWGASQLLLEKARSFLHPNCPDFQPRIWCMDLLRLSRCQYDSKCQKKEKKLYTEMYQKLPFLEHHVVAWSLCHGATPGKTGANNLWPTILDRVKCHEYLELVAICCNDLSNSQTVGFTHPFRAPGWFLCLIDLVRRRIEVPQRSTGGMQNRCRGPFSNRHVKATSSDFQPFWLLTWTLLICNTNTTT